MLEIDNKKMKINNSPSRGAGTVLSRHCQKNKFITSDDRTSETFSESLVIPP
jgi:hypothetical protein